MSSTPLSATTACSNIKKCQCYIHPCKRCNEEYDDCICFKGKYLYHFTCETFEALQHCEFRHEILKEIPMLSYWIHKYDIFEVHQSNRWQYKLYQVSRCSKYFSPLVVKISNLMLSLMENEQKYKPELFIALLEYLVKNVAFLHKHERFQAAIIKKINELLSLQQTSIILEDLIVKHFNVSMHESIIEWLGLFYS